MNKFLTLMLAISTISAIVLINELKKNIDLQKTKIEILETKSQIQDIDNKRLKRIAIQLYNHTDERKIKKDTNLVKDLLIIGYNN